MNVRPTSGLYDLMKNVIVIEIAACHHLRNVIKITRRISPIENPLNCQKKLSTSHECIGMNRSMCRMGRGDEHNDRG